MRKKPLLFGRTNFSKRRSTAVALLACEAIDVFQRNLNANFSLLTRLAGARSFAEILELQATHLSNQASALIGQNEELTSLSIRTAFDLLRGRNVSPSDL